MKAEQGKSQGADNDIVTPAQAAKLKGVSRTAIYNALGDGRLQSVRILGRIGIARSVLKAWQPQAQVGRPIGRPMTEKAESHHCRCAEEALGQSQSRHDQSRQKLMNPFLPPSKSRYCGRRLRANTTAA